MIVQLPPPGLMIPCEKPAISGIWPDVVTDDIPNLKAALSECAQHTDDYLKWRAEHENGETKHE
ncbi:Rz1-like lysis system protein LysC [Vibrio quintilis]|uniref:Rz1-like lysis system protein LysC n=1 Tax=Vibrio quintilis TaxID=1117707 RepID=UPI001F1E09DA|nr:hypothetical protein [Vibrio quintilis]